MLWNCGIQHPEINFVAPFCSSSAIPLTVLLYHCRCSLVELPTAQILVTMYGGLFGNLPATKNDDKNTDRSCTSANLASAPSLSEGLVVDRALTLNPVESTSLLLMPQFVPKQAAARRKQQQQQLHSKQSRKRTAPVLVTADTSHHQNLVSSDRTVHRRIDEKNEDDEAHMFIHHEDITKDSVEEDQLQEPEPLRILHEQAKLDLYDPLIPNDLLLYWERKSLAAEREKLFQEQQTSIREQEELRQQLKREREQLQIRGDYTGLVEHHRVQNGIGRGRGGVSNLPAWLVEKQKKEVQQGDHASTR